MVFAVPPLVEMMLRETLSIIIMKIHIDNRNSHIHYLGYLQNVNVQQK